MITKKCWDFFFFLFIKRENSKDEEEMRREKGFVLKLKTWLKVHDAKKKRLYTSLYLASKRRARWFSWSKVLLCPGRLSDDFSMAWRTPPTASLIIILVANPKGYRRPTGILPRYCVWHWLRLDKVCYEPHIIYIAWRIHLWKYRVVVVAGYIQCHQACVSLCLSHIITTDRTLIASTLSPFAQRS